MGKIISSPTGFEHSGDDLTIPTPPISKFVSASITERPDGVFELHLISHGFETVNARRLEFATRREAEDAQVPCGLRFHADLRNHKR